MDSVRMDRYLWAVRLCRTRSLATEACRKGSVRVAGKAVKPSRLVKAGDAIEVRRDGIWRLLRVREVLVARVGAKLVPNYLDDLTPPEAVAEALEKRKAAGRGRPTKKDRRDLEKLLAADGEHERHFREMLKRQKP